MHFVEKRDFINHDEEDDEKNNIIGEERSPL